MLFRNTYTCGAEVPPRELVALAVDAWKTFAEVRREGGHALLYCRGVRRDGREGHPVRPVAAPSARPGSPKNARCASGCGDCARRGSVRLHTRLEMTSAVLRLALCSRASPERPRTRSSYIIQPSGETSERWGRVPGRVCETRHSKNTGERCGLRLPAEAERGADARFGISQAALATHGPLPRRRRLRPALC